MRIALLLPLIVAACDGADPTGPAGDWTATLTCDDDGDLPECPDGPRILLRIGQDDAAFGEHRSFLPGHRRPDGSWTGMPGSLHGAFTGSELSLTLLPDLDDPFASEGDRDDWSTHSLVLTGSPAGVCWTASWQWIRDDGTVDASGDAELVRRDRICP
jgi:hypothetical protein